MTAPEPRPPEPSKDGFSIDYRNWECSWNAEAASWGCEGWEAYRGGCDLDAPRVTGKTWTALLDEIDAEEDA